MHSVTGNPLSLLRSSCNGRPLHKRSHVFPTALCMLKANSIECFGHIVEIAASRHSRLEKSGINTASSLHKRIRLNPFCLCIQASRLAVSCSALRHIACLTYGQPVPRVVRTHAHESHLEVAAPRVVRGSVPGVQRHPPNGDRGGSAQGGRVG